MTDAAYFAPKAYSDRSLQVALLAAGLITIQEYDDITDGDWTLEAIQAAADLIRDGRASRADFRRFVMKADTDD